jgi:hypothetical protein
MTSTRTRRPGKGQVERQEPPGSPLAALVDRYADELRPSACQRLSFYANQPSLVDVLAVVRTWRDEDGNVEQRQRRLPQAVRDRAAERLADLDLADADRFRDVFARVQEMLAGIRGLGEVALYDVALRLGAMLGLPPENVYLHGSSREGARALGIRTGERSLPRDAFPPELARLHAWEIEAFLCHYKVELAAQRAIARLAA